MPPSIILYALVCNSLLEGQVHLYLTTVLASSRQYVNNNSVAQPLQMMNTLGQAKIHNTRRIKFIPRHTGKKLPSGRVKWFTVLRLSAHPQPRTRRRFDLPNPSIIYPQLHATGFTQKSRTHHDSAWDLAALSTSFYPSIYYAAAAAAVKHH